MHLMLQNAPDDYVVATGVHHSVQEWMDETYSYYKWEPDVEISEFEKRPWDVDVLSGDPSKIKSLGWEPEYGFKGLVQDMVGRY